MSSGLEMHEAHFPGRAPIDAYGNGGFRFADMSHTGSLLCLPSGIYAWNIKLAENLSPQSFERVLNEAAEIEVLLVGTGTDIAPLSLELKACFREHGIGIDAMSTGAAVRTFNVLLSEKRAVAAALVAVDQ
jgi:uncharacterized protein